MSAFESHRAGFLEALLVQRYSPATRQSYSQGLTLFFGFLSSVGVADLREVTRETLRAYKLWLSERPYSDWSRYSFMQAPKRLFAWLERTDAILVNPCTDLIACRVPKRLPRGVLTREQVHRVLNAPDTQTHRGIRDKTILELFYSTGLRLGELAALKVFDVDHRNGFVRVNLGKGGKDRIVPMGSKASDYVREYLTEVRAVWIKESHANSADERALWLGSVAPHAPLKAQAIEVMVKQYGREVGVRVTPHLWRHTCATHLVASGASIVAVARQLGHRNLYTTQIYTRVAVPDLVRMHAKTHPRSRARKQ